MRYLVFFTILILATGLKAIGQKSNTANIIIPAPKNIEWGVGDFVIDARTKLVTSNGDTRKIAGFFIQDLKLAANIQLQQVSKAPSTNYILFRTDKSLKSEHYQLSINPDRVVVSAADYNGFLYGVQTLKQLLPPQIFSKTIVSKTAWSVPAAEIEDGPRFAYRGLMLDLSRHFFFDGLCKTGSRSFGRT
ncbi:MAG: beta-N-acetylhexosaminidase [Chitinophagaceae bacterium]|nr:beta-N-acetylhexosaminidase [Chitinophagaceae bacterium]